MFQWSQNPDRTVKIRVVFTAKSSTLSKACQLVFKENAVPLITSRTLGLRPRALRAIAPYKDLHTGMTLASPAVNPVQTPKLHVT